MHVVDSQCLGAGQESTEKQELHEGELEGQGWGWLRLLPALPMKHKLTQADNAITEPVFTVE